MAGPVFHFFDRAAAPVAPFSHAVECDGWVQLTGQMPTDPNDDTAPLPDGIEAQTRRVMDNLIIVLGELGLDLSHVRRPRPNADLRPLPVGPTDGARWRPRGP